MNKKFYRITFESAFDNALIEAIRISSIDDSDITWGIGFGARNMLFRMIWAAHDMDIITYCEAIYLRDAVKAIIEVY